MAGTGKSARAASGLRRTVATPAERPTWPREKPLWLSVAWSVGPPIAATLVCWAMEGRIHEANQIMVYLLAVAVVGSGSGPVEALLSVVLSVFAFDFFFVEPKFGLILHDLTYIPTYSIMMLVGLLISSLTARLRAQARRAASRERSTAVLYDLTRGLAEAADERAVGVSATDRIREELGVRTRILALDDSGLLADIGPASIEWPAGLPLADAKRTASDHAGETMLTLSTASEEVGALLVSADSSSADLEGSRLTILETFANSLAMAIQRARLEVKARDALVQVESERMRSSLLGSVSHDLRTPLTSIAGAASTLTGPRGSIEDVRVELASTIFSESERLNRHIRDMLDMTRLETGIQPHLEWQSIEELIGGALSRTESLLKGRQIDIRLDPAVPLIHVDEILVEKALVNLLENVGSHTPAGKGLAIEAGKVGEWVQIVVSDEGTGIDPKDLPRIFDRFYTSSRSSERGGYGMGLAICRTIMLLHRGTIEAGAGRAGGARFVLRFPAEAPPEVPVG